YLLCLVTSFSCMKKDDSVLAAFDVYCEMVANDAKPLGLHYPMTTEEVDHWWDDFQEVAAKHQVSLFRENDFSTSLLFPAELTQGKTVVLIYKGHRLSQYQQWKSDVNAKEGHSRNEEEKLARRFGRLLGYSPQGINQLLSKNTDYRNLKDFGLIEQVTHLYYEDLGEAILFYSEILGFTQMKKGYFQISSRAALQLHALNDNHPHGQTKSTAIALLTDQLPAWYEHLNNQNIPIKYSYKPKEGGPHDGFVAIDPGGYLLEFEYFKQHPENELFKAVLDHNENLQTTIKGLGFYASITWTYHKDLLLMQQFYEEILGCQLVADQGWTKIYQTSPTAFIGLVDERRGMEDYSDTKAVEIEWKVEDFSAFTAYAKHHWQQYEFEKNTFKGPELYIYRVSPKK
ncbi:MAG: VOC family protein, partial [Bacteroidota bacterium]